MVTVQVWIFLPNGSKEPHLTEGHGMEATWRRVPICSMGLVYLLYIYHRFMVNVVKYTINGAYGHVWG